MAKLLFTAHEDRSTGDWVIRVEYGSGSFVSIGSANGMDEADMIAKSLNLACDDRPGIAETTRQMWMKYVHEMKS